MGRLNPHPFAWPIATLLEAQALSGDLRFNSVSGHLTVGKKWSHKGKRYSFVNAAQLLSFHRPVTLFSRVRVHSQVLWFDQRWVYFQHDFHAGAQLGARLLVKMKFKHGSRTIDPAVLLGVPPAQRSALVDSWNASLEIAALD